MEDGTLLNTIYEAGMISDYAINPDGTRFITTKWGGYILVYELPSGKLLSTYGTGLQFPLAHFSIDGKYILVNYGNQVRNITNGIQEEIENVSDIKPDRIQEYVSLPNERLWAIQHVEGLQELHVGSNNSLVAWGMIDQTIFRWEPPQQSFTPYVFDTRRIYNMVISHNGDTIAACMSDGLVVALVVTNVDSGQSSNWGDCQSSVAFSPDDQLLIRNDRMVDYLAFPDGELSANLRDYDFVASTPSGNYLMTISQYDGRYVIWTADLASRYPLADSITETVTSFVVSPDETMVVSADDRVRFWRLSDGWQIKIISIEARSLAFSPDGSMLAVGGQDGTIHLFHMPYGDEIIVLNGHKDVVVDLEFTLDGANIISLSADGTIRLWGIAP
jgi:WD40 repeat protein